MNGSPDSYSSSGQPGLVSVLRRVGLKLALYAGVALVILYFLGVTTVYFWLHSSRQIEGVTVLQVALLRTTDIRRAVAAHEFAQAQVEWKAKNIQAAYVNFISAVHRDPDNTAGRLEAAQFLAAVGATNLQLNLLEEGIERHPEDRSLNEKLFGLLLTSGRAGRALELLRGKFAAGLSGPNALLLQNVELQATLVTAGGPAALAVLNRHPSLRQDPEARPIVARVLWESGDKTGAIALMSAQVKAQPTVFAHYAQLADWQMQAGQVSEAVATAMQACKRFPKETSPRVLLLEIGSTKIVGTPEWSRELALYLRDFSDHPEALTRLAEMAGRRGLIELAHALYVLGAVRHEDLGRLALCFSDALASRGQIPAARAVLAQIEPQAPEGSTGFLVQLRQRQVLLAAAAGEREGVREYSRRLAALLHNDPDSIEKYRQLYGRLGLAEAVQELSDSKSRPAAKASTTRI